MALGYPANASTTEELTATEGVVSIVNTRFDLEALDVPKYPNVIQTDAAINPGNSGGPLVDLEAKLVGVNSAGITLLGGRTIQGQGFAIGVDRVKEVTDQLRQGRSIGWTGMGFAHGVSGSDLVDAGLPLRDGLVVTHVAPGSPAAAAGLGEQPAMVTAINGQSVDQSLPSYCDAVESIESGGTATFTVVRAGSTAESDVQVGFK